MPEELPDQSEMVYHMPFLEELARNSAVIIEIGCGLGNGSTRAFARGLKESPREEKAMISVDMEPEYPRVKPDLPYWSFVCGRSEHPLTVNQVRTELFSRPADIIFIDTEHTYDQMQRELRWWSLCADQNTTWVFHDTWMFGFYNTMTDAIKEFCNDSGTWEFVDLTRESHGLGLMRWRK